MIPAFSFSRLPRILFGPGTRAKLPELIQGYGRRALLVTGARSFQDSPHWRDLQAALEAAQWSGPW